MVAASAGPASSSHQPATAPSSSSASPSTLERVVVYANGALVTRRVPVTAGATRVVVDGLPLRFVDDTLRVRPLEGAEIVVGLVEERCRLTLVGAPARERVASPMGSALLDARLALAEVDQRLETLQTLRGVAQLKIALPPADVAMGAPDLPRWLGMMDRAGDRLDALDAEERELRAIRMQRARHLRDVEAEQVDDVESSVRRGIEIAVEAPSAGVLEVDYFVAAARWSPSYSLRLARAGSGGDGDGVKAQLVLGALVAQATGEDWDDVLLSVATSSLARDCTLPTLESWRLGRAQPAKPLGFRPLPTDLPGLFSAWDRFPEVLERTVPSPSPSPPPPPLAPQMPRGAPRPPSAPPSEPSPVMRREDNARSAMMAPQASFGAPMMEKAAAAAADDDDYDDDVMEEGGVDELEASADEMLAMPMAASAPMRSRGSFAKAKKMSGGFGGGGGGRGGAVAEPPPPRLRTTGLRLAFADEAGVRGTLLPMNLRERLAWLLEVAEVGWEGVDVDVHADADANTAAASHGLEVDRAAALQQALFQLENAEARLTGRPAPAGVKPLTSSPARIFGGVTRTSIPDDGRDHRVEVHREAGAVDIIHLAVPRESFNVWRTCAFSPSGALPAGPVQVSEDGVFVVAGVADGSGGAAMHFNLGIDPQVKIESRTPTIRQSEKGLMGGQSVVEHSVVTEIRSTADHRVTLKVFDRFPVAGTNVKDVEVEVGECSPPVKRENRDHEGRVVHGGFRTDVVLMPRDLAVLRHAYAISLPAKLELSGGNRRE